MSSIAPSPQRPDDETRAELRTRRIEGVLDRHVDLSRRLEKRGRHVAAENPAGAEVRLQRCPFHRIASPRVSPVPKTTSSAWPFGCRRNTSPTRHCSGTSASRERAAPPSVRTSRPSGISGRSFLPAGGQKKETGDGGGEPSRHDRSGPRPRRDSRRALRPCRRRASLPRATKKAGTRAKAAGSRRRSEASAGRAAAAAPAAS